MPLFYRKSLKLSGSSIWLGAVVSGLLFCTFTLAAKPGAQSNVMLATYPLAQSPGLSLRLTIAPCKKKSCNVFVQLVQGEKVISQLPLKWDANTQDHEQQQVGNDFGYGVGDPLDESTQWQSWILGQSEENSVSVIVQPITLADGIEGLAVNQTGGFEHIKRNHAVYIVTNSKLLLAWEYTEGAGPHWSKMISPVNVNGSRELIILSGFRSADNETADVLDIGYLSWNPKTGKVQKKSSGHTPLYYVVVYPFNDIPTAQTFKQSHSDCLGNFSLLDKESNIKKFFSKITFVAVTHIKKLAEQVRDKVVTCLPANKNIKVEIVSSVLNNAELNENFSSRFMLVAGNRLF